MKETLQNLTISLSNSATKAFQQKDWVQTIQFCKKILLLDRSSPHLEIRWKLISAYMKINDVQNAVTELHDLTSKDPKNHNAWNLIGVALSEQTNFEKALFYFETASRLVPRNPEILENIRACKQQLFLQNLGLQTENIFDNEDIYDTLLFKGTKFSSNNVAEQRNSVSVPLIPSENAGKKRTWELEKTATEPVFKKPSLEKNIDWNLKMFKQKPTLDPKKTTTPEKKQTSDIQKKIYLHKK